ncbi:MAG: HAD-IIA family hydrolase [Bacillota bacterium]|nr:HAD-IIA family hydrolase [Bacillota bacterium]
MIRGVIFDLDGTIYRGEALLPGAREALTALRLAGIRRVFLSNKPLERPSAYAAKLTRLGIPTTEAEVINSSRVLAAYLRRAMPAARLLVVGEPPLKEELAEAGLVIVEDSPAVDCVVLAFDRTFDYRKLNLAFQAAKFHGARLVATNADRSCPVDGGEIPDAAGMIAAVEATTGRKVELVAGKPSPLVVEAALDRLGVRPEEALMVGDRLETDIAMGRAAGLKTALVLSGVTARRDLEVSAHQPDYVWESVAELPAALGLEAAGREREEA